ncbi:MAG: YhgE/Pip domain-containing protein, partial [Agrococcus casei]
MKLPQLALAELRRLTATPMSRLALLALAIVPLLYGGIYLWANQDPYSNLDQVPAALVVEDTGHGSGDDRQNVGQDVAENVIEDGSFDWHLVNAEEAAAGVDNGDYDFSLTLPRTFTEDLLSASTDNPHPATIEL